VGSLGVKVLVASRSTPGVDKIAERVESFLLFQALVLLKFLQSFCLNIGWLYTRLVASNSFAPEYREDYHGSVVDDVARPTRLNNSIQEFMAMYIYSFSSHVKFILRSGLGNFIYRSN
jgi:hypothetical protein